MLINERLTEKKEMALMVIIQRMLARYQEIHLMHLDEEMFVFFEKAKRIHNAKEFLTIKDAIE